MISLKDKSAHSILFKDKVEAESFADFIQSVVEQVNRLVDTKVTQNIIEITKE